MTESMMYAVKAAMNSSSTWDSTAVGLEFLSFSIKESIDVVQDDGIRGTRGRPAERLALGNVSIAGQLVLEPTPKELDALLPCILGANPTGTTFALAETLPDLYIQADFIAKVYTFLLRVTKAEFSAESGKKLRLTLDCVGKTLTIGNAGTYSGTVPAPDLTSRPYMMSDATLSINSVAYSLDQFKLSVDNKIEPTYMQGATATDLEPTDRVVMLHVRTKYTSSEIALQTDTRAGAVRTASAAFTNGGTSLTFAMAGILPPKIESPEVDSKTGKLRWTGDYQCYTASTTKELVVTNDSTP